MITCPLCNESVDTLHKKSHLLPEWMYTDYYDEKHKLIKVDIKKEKVNKKQKGEYTPNIICEDCEKESQVYDRYGSLVLTARSPEAPEHKALVRESFKFNKDGEIHNVHRLKNLDFGQLQRFVFACVLRTHLSEKLKGDYLLFDKHFDKLLSIYKDTAIIDDSSYPIMIGRYPDDDKFRDHIYLPFKTKKSGHHAVEFSGAGYFFWVFVSSHKKPTYVNNLSLKQDGYLHINEIYFKDCGTFKSMESSLNLLAKKYPEP